jgi:hypothetical protein
MTFAWYAISRDMFKETHKIKNNEMQLQQTQNRRIPSGITATIQANELASEIIKINAMNTCLDESISDEFIGTIESIFSLKMKMKYLLLAVFGGFSVGAISGFVAEWIFDPAISYFALIGLIFADHATGVTIAWRRNQFQTRKALRIFWTLVSHTGLLIFSTNLAKGSNVLFWLNEAVFVPVVLVNMLSLIKNLSILGWIKKDLASILYKKIDLHKNEIDSGNLDHRNN